MDLPINRLWTAAVLALVATATGGQAACRAAPPDAPPAAAVEAVEPDIYYLRDDGGRLVPVPGFRYRDFVDLVRIRAGLPGLPEPPAAVLERIEISGRLDGADRDTAPVTVRAVLRQARDGWARVPLGLDGLVITAPPDHEGPGRFIIDADPRGGGYEAWIEAPVDSRHTLTLAGIVAVDRGPVSETVRLTVPRATASLIRLTTARDEPRVDVRPAGAVVTLGKAEAPNASVVECAGVVGPTTIVIGPRGDAAGAGEAPPQSHVESVVRIDGTIATISATVRIESLPADRRDVAISLPPGSRLVGVAPPAELVRIDGPAEAAVAVIGLQPDATGRGVVELTCERPIESRADAVIEPLGFAVAGIPTWRQRGRVSLVVEGDWQVDWEDAAGNRRVDPPLAARSPGFVAAFAFDAQPASLPLRVRPRGSRVVVEPTYRYAVGASRIGLEARLRVGVRGAPVTRLVVALEGWNVDEVGPTGIVDAPAVTTEGGRLVVPFLQPLTGEATIEARCSLSIDRAATDVGWTLPVPRADLVGPAEVTIASDSDIEILPEVAAIRGLVRQVAPATQTGDSPVLSYRLDGVEGRFAARRRFLARRVDAAVSVQAAVNRQRIRVEETIRFTVANVPLEFVDLAVSRALLEGGTLEIRQAGDLLNPFEVSTAAPAREGVGTLRVMLASPLLGVGDVTVTYEVPTPEVPEAATVAESLPLVLPLDARIVRQSASVTSADPFAFDLRGTAWTREAALPSAGASRVWTAAGVEADLPLVLTTRLDSGLADTTVEAAWYETRLLPDRHDETFTCAITTVAAEVRLTLPGGFDARRTDRGRPPRFRVDGAAVSAVEEADGSVRIPLPTGDAGRRGHVLVVETSRPRSAPPGLPGLPARLVLEPVAFPPGTVHRRFYWELRLESDEHVVVPPGGWTSQQRWQWGPFGPEYAPLVSHPAIAGWIAAAAGQRWTTPEMPVAERRVVYAGVGEPGIGRVWLAPTWFLVLVVSGLTLAAGLAVSYRPAVRRPSVLLACGAVAALAGSLVPDLLPLVGLAAVPGLLLVALAAVLRLVVERPPSRRPTTGVVFADSSTRLGPAASIVIAPSALGADATTAARGGDA